MDSFVRSRLTYCCQNWNLNQAQFDRLDVAYRRFLTEWLEGVSRGKRVVTMNSALELPTKSFTSYVAQEI